MIIKQYERIRSSTNSETIANRRQTTEIHAIGRCVQRNHLAHQPLATGAAMLVGKRARRFQMEPIPAVRVEANELPEAIEFLHGSELPIRT